MRPAPARQRATVFERDPGDDQPGGGLDPKRAVGQRREASEKEALVPGEGALQLPAVQPAGTSGQHSGMVQQPRQPPRGERQGPARPLAVAAVPQPFPRPVLRCAPRRGGAQCGEVVEPAEALPRGLEGWRGRGRPPERPGGIDADMGKQKAARQQRLRRCGVARDRATRVGDLRQPPPHRAGEPRLQPVGPGQLPWRCRSQPRCSPYRIGTLGPGRRAVMKEIGRF